jgi:hypothetical protein
MIIVVDADRAEADLAASTLACPRCGGLLRPWTRAARRQIRLRDGSTRWLQTDEVYWEGQPIAVVVAETSAIAREAAALVHAEYAVSKSVVDFEAAANDARSQPNNSFFPQGAKRGNAEAALKTTAVALDLRYTTPPHHHNALELHDVVMTSDDTGVEDATSQLLALGHRRIAALAGRADSFRAAKRLASYRIALSRHGVEEPPGLVMTDLTTSDQARTAAARLLDGPEPPTAVLALNLGIGIGIGIGLLLDRIAHQRGNALIVLDETEVTAGLGISAICRDSQEVGRVAAALALERIAHPTAPARTVTLPSTLIKRGSGELRP